MREVDEDGERLAGVDELHAAGSARPGFDCGDGGVGIEAGRHVTTA